MRPMVEVHQLTKSYPDAYLGTYMAVRNISFQVEAGEIFGLLGPNGAGKTTALRILSTVLKPSSGQVRINGFDCLTHASQVRHSLGFVSVNTAIYERMTAWEMVEYFGRLHGFRGRELTRRMETIFERLQMLEFRDLLGGKMSTGMRQKVSIARALIHDPPVLIFDEASSGLDVMVNRSLQEIIRQLRDEGKSIIYSTHVMREVERLCDRVAVMSQGRIVAEGPLNQLQKAYAIDDLEDLFLALIQGRAAPEELATA
jgi:sodium transport system ATP-binding protein